MTFIALEGIDGTGKTTLSRALAHALASRDSSLSIIQTREPYRLSARAAAGMSRPRRFLAFQQDRVDHLETLADDLARPSTVVICDRYYLSTAAYQAESAGAARAYVKVCADLFPEPDLWIYLDASVEEARRRCEARGAAWDWPGDQMEDVHRRYQSAYLRAPGRKVWFDTEWHALQGDPIISMTHFAMSYLDRHLKISDGE